MNLEDRLRSHMHSAEDLFVEGQTSASDISAAGSRRTRRNQVGAGLAAGVLGIGLVLGATMLTGSSDTDDIAADESVAEDFAAAELAPADSAMESSMFDGPIPSFDVIVGVEDGFVGLRNNSGVISRIESIDGVTWVEGPTTGLEDNTEIAALAFGDGVFAAVFRTFDKVSGVPQNFIGSSTDGANWTLVSVLGNQPDAFLSGLAIGDGNIVSAASAFGVVGEDDDGEATPTGYVIRGPVGGPYTETVLDAVEFGVERIESTTSGFALSAFGDGLPVVWVSPDGESWSRAAVADESNQFATITTLENSLLSIGSTDLGGAGTFQIFASSNGGMSWAPVDVPPDVATAPWWSFEVRSNGDVAAVLLTGEAEQAVDGPFATSVGLLVSDGGSFIEVDLGAYVPQGASAILMGVSADEVLLQVIEESETSYVRVPLT